MSLETKEMLKITFVVVIGVILALCAKELLMAVFALFD